MNWILETDTDTEKVWFNEDRTYRIQWRSKFMGVSFTPKFAACFQYLNNGKPCWDLVSRHNKLEPAQKASERHFNKAKRLAKRLAKQLAKNPPKPKRQRRHVNRGATFGQGRV